MATCVFLLSLFGVRNAKGQEDLQTLVRRLQTTPSLPSACIAACPDAEGMLTALTARMAPFQASSGGGNDAQAIGQMKPMLHCSYEFMCENKATYKCLEQNMAVCAPESSSTGGPSQPTDPLTMSNYLDCICDSCPGTGPTYANLQFFLFETLMSAFGGAQQEDPMTNMYTNVCPYLTAKTCFDNNAATCAAANSSLSTIDTAALAGNCTAHGISTDYAPSECPAEVASSAAEHGPALGLLGGLLFALVSFIQK